MRWRCLQDTAELTDPDVAAVRLEITSRMVDLPAPEGPMTADRVNSALFERMKRPTGEHLAGLDSPRDVVENVLIFDREAYSFPFEHQRTLARLLGLVEAGRQQAWQIEDKDEHLPRGPLLKIAW